MRALGAQEVMEADRRSLDLASGPGTQPGGHDPIRQLKGHCLVCPERDGAIQDGDTGGAKSEHPGHFLHAALRRACLVRLFAPLAKRAR